MARASIWLAILALLVLNLMQFYVLNDVVQGMESVYGAASKAENSAVAASDAQFRAQVTTRSVAELQKTLVELRTELERVASLVDALPEEVKKQAVDEARALIPPAVDEDALRVFVMRSVNERLAKEMDRSRAEIARLEKRLVAEMNGKKPQSFHVEQPLPLDEPNEPASPEIPN